MIFEECLTFVRLSWYSGCCQSQGVWISSSVTLSRVPWVWECIWVWPRWHGSGRRCHKCPLGRHGGRSTGRGCRHGDDNDSRTRDQYTGTGGWAGDRHTCVTEAELRWGGVGWGIGRERGQGDIWEKLSMPSAWVIDKMIRVFIVLLSSWYRDEYA